MIPKKIHYIWLGPKPLDNVSKKCISTWKAVLPEYEIECWDDEKCSEIINNCQYAKEALQEKKYAFVSDYIRLYVLYNYGGIYMDTDVQVFKSLDKFLNDDVFTSYEYYDYIPTALWAAQKGHPWIKMLLNDYDDRHFVLPDGTYDTTSNVQRTTMLTEELGFKIDGRDQIMEFEGGRTVHIYTKDYFCPINYYDRSNDCFTENTYAAHLFNASWYPWWRRIGSKIKKRFGLNPKKIFGEKLYAYLTSRF